MRCRSLSLLFLVPLLLALASPLTAQAKAPICTVSRTARALPANAKGTTWANGVLKSFYLTPGDSVGTSCTGFPTVTVADSAALKLLQLALADTTARLVVVRAEAKRLQDSLAKLAVVTPPKPDIPPPNPTQNALYFNSAEAGCSAAAGALLCDDFDDGSWYGKNCDVANASGGLLQNDGWCGTIYAQNGNGQPNGSPITPAGAARCGNLGIKSNCVATSGAMTGGTTGNMGDHALYAPVDEVWVRFYTKPLEGYTFGAEKMLTFNDGSPGGGGIRFGNLSWNCASISSSTGKLTMGFPVPMDVCQSQNQGNNITIEAGNWYFYEVHYKLSAPGQANGVFELWVDNCGPAGTTCPATPTLRLRRTDVNNDRSSPNELIRVLWFEAWSNPVSRGERWLDQVKVARTGPIGFML